MDVDGGALRPEIAQSWRRAELFGLSPDSSVDCATVADIDRRSRLVVAAGPVLDQAARELAGTAFSLVLADRDAWIVDRRFGESRFESVLDRVGVVPGKRFTEENTGTNSIATVFELRQGLAVLGHEHFIDSFKDFACYYVEPTVLVDVREDMSVVREEIFGPVVAAIPFSAEDGPAAAANRTEYGLAAGIWTRDVSKAHRTARQIKAGSVWVNCYNGFDTAIPFGGYKQSGWGRELGAEAIDLYTQTKAVNVAL